MASRRRRLVNGKRRSQPYTRVPCSPFGGMTVGQVEDLPPKKRQRMLKQHNGIALEEALKNEAIEKQRQRFQMQKDKMLKDFELRIQEIEKQLKNDNDQKMDNSTSNKSTNKSKSKSKSSSNTKNSNKTKSKSSEDEDDHELQDIDVLPTNANLAELDARVVRDCGVLGSAKLVAKYCGQSNDNSKSNSNSNSNHHYNNYSNSNSNDNSNGTINNVINVFQVSGEDIEDVDVSTTIAAGGSGNGGGNGGANQGANPWNSNSGPPPLEKVSGSRIVWTNFMCAGVYRIFKDIADTGKINGRTLHGGANLTNGEWALIHRRFQNEVGLVIDVKKLQSKWNRTVGSQGKTRCPRLHALFAPLWEQIKVHLSKSTSSNS